MWLKCHVSNTCTEPLRRKRPGKNFRHLFFVDPHTPQPWTGSVGRRDRSGAVAESPARQVQVGTVATRFSLSSACYKNSISGQLFFQGPSCALNSVPLRNHPRRGLDPPCCFGVSPSHQMQLAFAVQLGHASQRKCHELFGSLG